jgi:hypothetical protein
VTPIDRRSRVDPPSKIDGRAESIRQAKSIREGNTISYQGHAFRHAASTLAGTRLQSLEFNI